MDVCFNGQISVDQKNHLIVDYDLTNDPTDYASLVPLTESSKEFLGSDKMESLSDKGYFSMGNVKSMAEDGIDAYIPEAKDGMPNKKTGMPKPEFHESRFVYNSEKDIYMCPERKEMHYLRNQKTVKGLKYRVYATAACESCPVRTGCTEFRRGHWIWKWGHPFGTMKRAMNAGYTLLKGKKKVKGEFGIIALTYNIKRVISIKNGRDGNHN